MSEESALIRREAEVGTAGPLAGPAPAGPPLRESALGSQVEGMVAALRDEIAAAKKDPLRHLWVFDGEPLWSNADGTHVRFRCDRATTLPPESPIVLLLEDDTQIDGTLISVEDFEVLVFLRAEVTEPIPRARLSSKPWFIHERLLGHLEGLLDSPHGDLTLPLALCGKGFTSTGFDREGLERAVEVLGRVPDRGLQPNEAQRQAIGKHPGQSRPLRVGPPRHGQDRLPRAGDASARVARGAGAASRPRQRRRRRCVASRRRCVRGGRGAGTGADSPYRPATARGGAAARADHPRGRAQATQPELIRQRDELEAEKKALTRALREPEGGPHRAEVGKRLDEVRAALVEVKKQIDAALEKLIQEARVLATTLSRSVIDARVQSWPAEALFLDEASMAPFPFFAAAAIAPERQRCVVFGDFRQLPPIVQATSKPAKEWLGRDAFEIGGVVEPIDRGEPEPKVTLLDIQYRMAPPIAEVVSRASYGGRLRSGEGAGRPAGSIPVTDPWKGSSVLFVDTTYLGAPCLGDPSPGSYSRTNRLHALVALDLAGRLRAGGVDQIALTTPYRAQARLFDALLGKHSADDPIRAATIHRFQGAERDVVLFDLTDAPPAKGPSRLTDRDPELARRLLNVAMSRARWKLIIGAFDFLLRRSSVGGPLREILGPPEGVRRGLEAGGVRPGRSGLGVRRRVARGLEPGGASRRAGTRPRRVAGLVVNWPAALPVDLRVSEALVRAAQRPGRPVP